MILRLTLRVWYSLCMTTNINPKTVRLALVEAGVDTNHLTIVPSSFGVLITGPENSIAEVIGLLHTIEGMNDFTHRNSTTVKINARPRRR